MFSTKMYIRSMYDLFQKLDPTLDAIGYGAEVTQLDAIPYGAEL
jgi:hypothetical protein